MSPLGMDCSLGLSAAYVSNPSKCRSDEITNAKVPFFGDR